MHVLISTLAALAETCRACTGTGDGGGQDCVGSGCLRVPSWFCVRMGFGHLLPAESLRGVIPTLLSLVGKDMKDKGTIRTRRTRASRSQWSSSSPYTFPLQPEHPQK